MRPSFADQFPEYLGSHLGTGTTPKTSADSCTNNKINTVPLDGIPIIGIIGGGGLH